MAANTTDDVEKVSIASDASPPDEPLVPVTSLVEWMTKNWAPLAAYTVLLVVAYWFEFRRVYAIPVSFVSSATIGALPALGGMVFGSVCLLTAFVLLPSVALWLPIGEGRHRLIDVHDAVDEPFRLAFWQWRNIGRVWLAVQVLFGIWVAGSLVALALLKFKSTTIQTVAFAMPVVFTLLALHPARVRAGISGWSAIVFNGVLGWAMLVQSLVVINVLQVSLGFIHGVSTASFLSVVIGPCVVIVAIVGQFVTAIGVKRGWRPVGGKWIVYAVLGLSTLPLGAPDLGASLVALPLRVSDPDGKPCVVLLASSRAVAGDWVGIATGSLGRPERSSPLPFATLIDGYHVKASLDGPTFTVPTDQVRGIDRCPASGALGPVAVPATTSTPPAAEGPSSSHPGWLWGIGDVVALGAVLVSVISLIVAIRIQRQSHRPLVSVRVRTHKSAADGIALAIVIENTGSRPAMEVSVRAKETDIADALAGPDVVLPGDVKRALLTGGVVPVLANGRLVSGGFGHTGEGGVWRAGASIPVTVRYQDVAGRPFVERARLHLADTTGFAQGYWAGRPETD